MILTMQDLRSRTANETGNCLAQMDRSEPAPLHRYRASPNVLPVEIFRISGVLDHQIPVTGLRQRTPSLASSLELHTHMPIFSSLIPCTIVAPNCLCHPANSPPRSLASSGSRPQTPPSSKNAPRSAQTPPPRTYFNGSSPTKRSASSQNASQPSDDWAVTDELEDDDNVENSEYMYNDGADEDEFGLPSISSMRRAAQKRRPTHKINDPGGGAPSSRNGSSSLLAPGRPSSRPLANSSDIAEEREPALYPSARKSEGKILRPQYKDILRGLQHLAMITMNEANEVTRPCKLATPHSTSCITSKC